MKQIVRYENGSYGVVDTNSITTVKMDGGLPVEYIEYTEENMKIYFPKWKSKPSITL